MNPLLLSLALVMLQPTTEPTAPAVATQAAEPTETPEVETQQTAKEAQQASVTMAPEQATKGDGYEQETLFSDGEVTHGGFGGPQIRYTEFGGGGAILMGGRGGWIIDHNLIVGAAGYGGSARLDTPILTDEGEIDQLGIGYGGFLLEYTLWPEKAVHASIATLLGAGGLSVGDMDEHMRDDFENRRVDRPGRNDAFFVVEPELLLELNLTKWMRLAMGGSYRFIYGVSRDEFENQLGNEDLRGASGTVLLKFGKF